MSAHQHKHRLVRLSRRALAGLAGCGLICLSGHGAVGADSCPDIVGNDLTIPNNCTYLISGSESYATVMVKAGGTLLLGSGAVLQISDTLTVHAQGVFRFAAASGTTPILRATGSLEISGVIQTTSGGDLGGVIAGVTQAIDTVRLVSGTISAQHGPIAIEADFENDGTVTANGGTDGFDVTFSGSILNGSIGTFEVTHANSEMIFNHDVSISVPSLSGDADFNVEAGLMYFQQSLTTAGGFRQVGGKVKVAAGKTFTANGAY